MPDTTRIDLFKEEMKFSAAHFTIFSAEVRENLHGHNFTLRVEIEAAIGEEGLAFDYTEVRQTLIDICKGLNEILLLPTRNPHLVVEDNGAEVVARFGHERLTFLKRDVRLLPLRNISLEELSRYILHSIVPVLSADAHRGIRNVVTRVFSGPGQSASSEWSSL